MALMALLIVAVWLAIEISLMMLLAKFIGSGGVCLVLAAGVVGAIIFWKIKKKLLAEKIAAGKSTPQDLQNQAHNILVCFLLAFPTLLTDVLALLSFIPKFKARYGGLFSQALAEKMNISAQRDDGTQIEGELVETLEQKNAKNKSNTKHSSKRRKRNA